MVGAGVVGLGLLAGVSSPSVSAAQAPTGRVEPRVVAGLGDSITRGYNGCGFFVACTSRSWSLGDSGQVDSVVSRLRAEEYGPVEAVNRAVSGAKADDLADQAARAVRSAPDLVTIQIGGNDACTETVASMTSTQAFEQSIRAAFDVLDRRAPSAELLVLSIPDPRRLWEAGRGSWWTRTVWSVLDVCPSVLSDPLDRSSAAVARRAQVHDRVAAYNDILADVCDERPRCRHDDGATFAYPFTLEEVSGWDHFHPNARGQAVLADLGWATMSPR